ncbi:p23 cell envelope protein [Borrelia hermsii]|nr:p23 cell envelope protein [Borrelia hermsii]
MDKFKEKYFMDMKILLLVPTAIFCMQCNNKGAQNLNYNQDESKRRTIKRNNYLSKFNHTKPKGFESPSNTLKQNTQEPYVMLEGTKKISLIITTKYATWIKNKAISIKGLDGKIMSTLENKLKYSYSISPVKLNGYFNTKIMPIVLFETTKNGGEDLEVISFNLTDTPRLDFNTRRYPGIEGIYKPATTEPSGESGYFHANPFWIPYNNKEVIPALTQAQYIKAKIKVKYKASNTIKEYHILLDTSYLVKLIQDILNRHPDITKTAPNFKL